MVQEQVNSADGKFAIVELAGRAAEAGEGHVTHRQYRVEEGDVLLVDHIDGEVGSSIEFGRPLLVQNGSDLRIGKPFVDGAAVKATILGHERGAKVLVFKFKKVKNYRRKRGHRQELVRLRIDSISL